ncbi:MAG: lysoplasmalogenase [Lachnospiraceae bacterium]|nr:lysoplasmalogenase [Lachnospiraceae bacterium]
MMMTWNSFYLMPLVPTIIAIIAYAWRRIKKKNILWLIESVACSCALICMIVFFLTGEEQGILWFLVIAFLVSILGDLIMKTQKADRKLLLGIPAFTVAHIFFLIYIIKSSGFSWLPFLILLVPFLGFFYIVLLPTPRMKKNKKLAVAGCLYIAISCLTLAAAVYGVSNIASRWVFLAAVVCLVISDFMIAFRELYEHNQLNKAIMPLYYICHILIAVSVVINYM